jgi:hypothetical protein
LELSYHLLWDNGIVFVLLRDTAAAPAAGLVNALEEDIVLASCLWGDACMGA